jgi:hypothetical protein
MMKVAGVYAEGAIVRQSTRNASTGALPPPTEVTRGRPIEDICVLVHFLFSVTLYFALGSVHECIDGLD